MTRLSRRVVCLALATVAVAAGAAAAAGEVIERLLAVASGRLIMASDVAAARALGFAAPGETDRELLDRLINRALVLVEVDRYAPPEPSEAAMAVEIARVRGRFPDAAAFDATLAVLGLDESRVRERIRQDLRLEAYLDERFVVALPTEDQVTAAYQADPGRFARSGASTLDQARSDVVRAIVEERRAPRVTEWVSGLRRRSRVIVLTNGDGGAPVSE